jgi:hypothetical protein
MSVCSARRVAGALATAILIATVLGCRPEKAPDVAFKVAEQTVKWTPELAWAAVKAARAASRQVSASHPATPLPPPPAYPPPPCSSLGPAPDGRPVYLCGGSPWVQDVRTGAWVLYAADQAGQPPASDGVQPPPPAPSP